MNFGKANGLYEVLFLNYHIKWGRFVPSKLEHNFLVCDAAYIVYIWQFGAAYNRERLIIRGGFNFRLYGISIFVVFFAQTPL